MKNISLVTILFLSYTCVLFAQPDSTKHKIRFGIGVTIAPDFLIMYDEEINSLPTDFTNIYFPINSNPAFRFEPEIGIWRTKSEDENSESSYMNIRFGVGLFAYKVKQKTAIYYGSRVGMVRVSRKTTYKSPSMVEDRHDSKSDIYFGIAVGGEYFFSDYFSLGAETQINYISIGYYDDDSDSSTSLISSRALLVIRIYPF